MEIISLNSVNSTQKYLIDAIISKQITPPIGVISKIQTNGVGSRDNSWVGDSGDLFCSFAIDLADLPLDLPLASASIYFSFIMKKILKEYNSDVWLKWPNDFYLGSDKIGGTITKRVSNYLICGIGINLSESKNNFKSLNIDITTKELFKIYTKELENKISWKQVFREFKIEFNSNRDFYAHICGEKRSLKDALLCEDGSLIINKKRIYSLRWVILYV